MGWLRSVGSLKLQVSFAEYSLFYRCLLQNIVCFIGLFCKRDPLFERAYWFVATMCICVWQVDIFMSQMIVSYGVAMVSRIDKIIGFFCRILSLLQGSFAKQTYDFIDPTSRSHPISQRLTMGWLQWVGSFKFLVSFAEYRLLYRTLLQKRPIIWRSLLIVATSYVLISQRLMA